MEESKADDYSQNKTGLPPNKAIVGEALREDIPSWGDAFKPRWQRFLESTGGTALITVLVGGILGQMITCSIQNSSKEREFQQAWMKARGDQALVTYNEYLNQQREVVKQAYELIGNSISASDDMIALTGPEFAIGSYEGVENQRGGVRKRYNSIDQEWRAEREKVGLLINYYHHGRPEVVAAWQELQNAVTAYNDCARQWYLEHPEPAETKDACKNEQENFRRSLSQFNVSLEAARQYAWEGWESPEKLKSALEKAR